ncbi:CarD family transcriptional regulator [Oceanobacillus sp. CF4.6]|uniref:CarD family transcriptional regulator n=1 Tax=Oceanobacillus sp. CF4.6 TaxID=3373080 RepID=UPI003EE44D73
MFKVGDVIIYSVHGLCEVDDICEKTYHDVTRMYYVLHPQADPRLTINTPVENGKVVMITVIAREEAEKILQSFQQPGIKWIEEPRQRYKEYNRLVHTGDRKEISKVVNTLMLKSEQIKKSKRKLYDQDLRLLTNTQNIMFKELAVALDTSYEEISERVTSIIRSKE